MGHLRGCVNDVTRMQEFLTARVGARLKIKTLHNEQATRDAVIEQWRRHLGKAGPGDVAIFHIACHGSHEDVPDRFRHLEPTGQMQTLVCADSRVPGVPDLADKELSVLIDEVAERGAHTVAFVDSCHSGGVTRGPEPSVSVRSVDPGPSRTVGYLTREGVRDTAGGAAEPVHVVLSACQGEETAKEQLVDGQVRGVFSTALLKALQSLGAGATYRELLTAAQCAVEQQTSGQVPVLYPVTLGGIADQPFLGGAAARPPAGFVLRNVGHDWEVDAGRYHGIPAPADHGAVVFAAVTGEHEARLAEVTAVGGASSTVKPVGWSPDPAKQYPAVIADVPLPAVRVVIGGRRDDDPDALRKVEQAVLHSGPGERPSAYLRTVPSDDLSEGLRLRVVATDGAFRILKGDGTTPVTADVPGLTEASARIVVAQLEHIARWHSIMDLGNPATSLVGAVKIEIIAARPGEQVAPLDAMAMTPDEHGELRLAYRRGEHRWEPPAVFVRLRNTWHRPLWCVLLNLTDRFRVHPNLFPGGLVGDGQSGFALQGKRITVSLPRGRDSRPGAEVKDWLKLLVAEERFGSLTFELPPLGEPVRDGLPHDVRGVLGRLGFRATSRDFDTEISSAGGGDWATEVLPLITDIPTDS
ncbi:hypothetical protein Lesp02_02090 [Lentzea sp. NBRC 105346]|nr:hypothetical protein Lesp02_02090 [Lentzea sp. NBRC 105346]